MAEFLIVAGAITVTVVLALIAGWDSISDLWRKR